VVKILSTGRCDAGGPHIDDGLRECRVRQKIIPSSCFLFLSNRLEF